MKKQDIVTQLLDGKNKQPQGKATAFAPSNIALCKYWGKRNIELNLPVTSSLSISLGDKGTETTLEAIDTDHDIITLNGNSVNENSRFAKRLTGFLDLFRQDHHFKVATTSNLPIAAGLASSASGFAALVLALDELFQWQLSKKTLSILARLGSGSASRSLWQGFVEWQAGTASNGLDSYAFPFEHGWPELQVGLLIIDQKTKSISSTKAMVHTVNTSSSYADWPQIVANDMDKLKHAIIHKDFTLLGETAESNAIAMHQTLHDSKPSVNYDLAETIALKKQVQQCRQDGLAVYFTQDAGPNIKLLYQKVDQAAIEQRFSLLK